MSQGASGVAEYPVIVYPDYRTDGSFCYVAYHPDLPGCVGYGDSIGEAKEVLGRARNAYLRSAGANGEVPPAPSPGRPMTLELLSGPAARQFSAGNLPTFEGVAA